MFTLNKEDLQEKIFKSNFIIIDEKVLDKHDLLVPLIKDKITFKVCGNPEDSKNLIQFERIIDFFLKNKITRLDTIVAIGGGAVSDLAGFVASSILRGVKWEVYPTTLLGMIDASIGGKVGINTKYGKNLIGAFHKPDAIHIYLQFLETLEKDDYDSGLGELIKYYFLSSTIYKNRDKGLKVTINSCIEYKNNIVDLDFEEVGKRKILNFGHTFGHAIEAIHKQPHGVCVYLGIKMLIDFLQPEHKTHFLELSSFLNIDFKLKARMDFDLFISYLGNDKKRVGDSIEFIMIKEVGSSYIEKTDIGDLARRMKENENYKNYFR